MKNLLANTGTLVGVTGVLLCIVAGIFRLGGNFYLQGFELLTIFNVGVALLVAACYIKLEGLR